LSTSDSSKVADIKPKWRERFDFFDAYGAPSSPAFRAAFKTLPRNKKRLVNFSFLGFFFGPFYFFALGLWKKALTLLAIALATTVLEAIFSIVTQIDIPRAVDTGISIGFGYLFGLCVNYAYYLKEVKGSQGWNPFEGMRF
jgi:Protein of unknown function (DUF2628)